MPAPARYQPAHVQLLELAIEARRQGLSFEAFWRRARRPGFAPVVTVKDLFPPPGAVRFPTDTGDRRASVAALDATKDGWRRAYDRLPPLKREHAVALLAPVVEEMERKRISASEPGRGFEPRQAVA